jgi:hypothetical protein
MESAPITEKIPRIERTRFCDEKCNATFRRARFDRAAT